MKPTTAIEIDQALNKNIEQDQALGLLSEDIGNITPSGIGAAEATHAISHATGGTDEVTPASIGASADTHNHDSAYAPIAHTTAELPHLATDPVTSTVYRWGLAVEDGVWGYKYEEVV